jgi:hypothetical protein
MVALFPIGTLANISKLHGVTFQNLDSLFIAAQGWINFCQLIRLAII